MAPRADPSAASRRGRSGVWRLVPVGIFGLFIAANAAGLAGYAEALLVALVVAATLAKVVRNKVDK